MNSSLMTIFDNNSPGDEHAEAVAAVRGLCPLPENSITLFRHTARTVSVDPSALPYADWSEIPRHGRIWHIDQKSGVLYHKKSAEVMKAASEKALSDIVWHAGFPIASTLLEQNPVTANGRVQVFSPTPQKDALPLRNHLEQQGLRATKMSDYGVAMVQRDPAFAGAYLAMWVSDVWTGNYDRHCDNVIVTKPGAALSGGEDALSYYGYDADHITYHRSPAFLAKVCRFQQQEEVIRAGQMLYPQQHRTVVDASLRAIETCPDRVIHAFHARVEEHLSGHPSFCRETFNKRAALVCARRQMVRPFLASRGLV